MGLKIDRSTGYFGQIGSWNRLEGVEFGVEGRGLACTSHSGGVCGLRCEPVNFGAGQSQGSHNRGARLESGPPERASAVLSGYEPFANGLSQS